MLVFCHLYNLAILSSPTVSKTLAGDLLPHCVIGDFSLQPEDLSFSNPLREWAWLLGHRGMRAGSWEISFPISRRLPYTDRHSYHLLRVRRWAGYLKKFLIPNIILSLCFCPPRPIARINPTNRLPGSVLPATVCSPLSTRKEPLKMHSPYQEVYTSS